MTEESVNPFALPTEDEIYKMRHKEREFKETVCVRALLGGWGRSA